MTEIKGYANPTDYAIIKLYESLTGERFISDVPLQQLKKDGVITIHKRCSRTPQAMCHLCTGCKITFNNGKEVEKC